MALNKQEAKTGGASETKKFRRKVNKEGGEILFSILTVGSVKQTGNRRVIKSLLMSNTIEKKSDFKGETQSKKCHNRNFKQR